jgi:hypothetical protein
MEGRGQRFQSEEDFREDLIHVFVQFTSWMASSNMTEFLRIFSYILERPSSYMTLQPLPSKFPYI